jgi:hypothetical protein
MSNLKSVLQEKKDDLIPILDNKELIWASVENICPFP